MKQIKYFFLLFLFPYLIYAEIPNIPDPFILWKKSTAGYDLFIKKLAGIESILLTESSKDPLLKETVYGLRTKIFYPVNGNETRILDGKTLNTGSGSYFLVDSTPEASTDLGQAFHLFIPEEVVFGYKGTKNGSIKVTPGIKLNLRLFEKKYADYGGAFKDQWITVKLQNEENQPIPTPLETQLFKENLPPTPDEFDFLDPELKDKIYSEEIHLKDKKNNVLGKTFYKIDENGNKVKDKYASYQYDDKGNLIKIIEYNPAGKLLSVYKFQYDTNGKRTKVDHLDASGDSVIIE